MKLQDSGLKEPLLANHVTKRITSIPSHNKSLGDFQRISVNLFALHPRQKTFCLEGQEYIGMSSFYLRTQEINLFCTDQKCVLPEDFHLITGWVNVFL